MRKPKTKYLGTEITRTVYTYAGPRGAKKSGYFYRAVLHYAKRGEYQRTIKKMREAIQRDFCEFIKNCLTQESAGLRPHRTPAELTREYRAL